MNESTIWLYYNISSSIVFEHVVKNIDTLVTSNAETITTIIDNIQMNIANILNDDNNYSVIDNNDTQSIIILMKKHIRPQLQPP